MRPTCGRSPAGACACVLTLALAGRSARAQSAPERTPLPSVAPHAPAADDSDWAGRYARRSIALQTEGGLSLQSVDVFFYPAGSRFGLYGGLAAEVRLVFHHVVIEPAVGLQISTLNFGRSTLLPGLATGLGVGIALALGRRVAFTPMLRAELSGSFDPLAPYDVNVAVEAPFAFFLSRNAFVEPFVNLGIAVEAGRVTGPALWVMGVGYRLGVVF